jgi:hypothetical protein
MTYNPSDVYEPYHDCSEDCVDARKNLKCCRDVFELQKDILQLSHEVEKLKVQICRSKKQSDARQGAA